MTHDPHVLCPQEAAKGGRKSQSSLHPPGVAGRGSRRLSVHDKRGPADFHEPEFRSEEDEPGGVVWKEHPASFDGSLDTYFIVLSYFFSQIWARSAHED